MNPHWHYAMLQLHPDDALIQPDISPPVPTREEAHSEIQSMLDSLARRTLGVESVAETWRRGAKDDTVYVGLFTFTIVECGGSCRDSAKTLLEEFAAAYRSAGISNVTIAQLPADWPN